MASERRSESRANNQEQSRDRWLPSIELAVGARKPIRAPAMSDRVPEALPRNRSRSKPGTNSIEPSNRPPGARHQAQHLHISAQPMGHPHRFAHAASGCSRASRFAPHYAPVLTIALAPGQRAIQLSIRPGGGCRADRSVAICSCGCGQGAASSRANRSAAPEKVPRNDECLPTD